MRFFCFNNYGNLEWVCIRQDNGRTENKNTSYSLKRKQTETYKYLWVHTWHNGIQMCIYFEMKIDM